MNQQALIQRNLAQIHWDRGDLERALEHCLRARELQLAPGADPLETIDLLEMAATIAANQGELDRAAVYLEEALALGEEAGARSRAGTLALLSSLAQAEGDFGRSAELTDRSLELSRREGGIEEAAAAALTLPGSYGHALKILERTLKANEEIAPRSLNTATSQVLIGKLYGAAGQPERGLEHLRRALELIEATAPGSTAMSDLLSEIAFQERDRGDLDAATEALERAIAVEESFAGRTWGLANCLVQLALLLMQKESYEEAEAHLEAARDILVETRAPRYDLAFCLHHLGSLRFLAGDHDAAERYGTEALRVFEETTPHSDVTVRQLTNMGTLSRQRGDLSRAIDRLERAIDAAEHLRAHAGTEARKEEIFALQQSPYQAIIACLYERDGPDDHARAFHYAERSRARALIELLAKRRLDLGATDAEQRALVDEERTLQERLAAIHARLSALRQSPTPAPELVTRLRHQQVELEEELERVRRGLLRAFPAYAQLAAPAPLTLDAVQRTLEPSTLMLEYDATGEETFVFAIRNGKFGMFELGATADELRDLTDATIGGFRRSSREDGADAGAVATLSERLLERVPTSFWDGVERVVVVPDGTLYYLPFEMLHARHDDSTALVGRYAVAYAPSATVLNDLRSMAAHGETAPTRQFVGFGDPACVENSSSAASGGPARVFRPTPLPGTRIEVESIAGEFGGRATVFLGEEATKWRAKSATTGYRFVHFATHGILDDENPLYAGLLFAPPRGQEMTVGGNLNDFLQVYEMFGLRLSAQVVVCSACQTGLGSIRDGEGIVGMSRAFFFAGARCVVVSLWPVPDLPTARLMRYFYEALREDDAPVDALRRAKLRARERYTNPYSWAAFVVIGLSW